MIRGRRREPWWPLVVVLVIVLAINCALYSCTNASCKRSGGHTVIVWGGRGGWFCDGGK